MSAVKKQADIELPQPRLKELTVSNFRCIGAVPVKIELDDIVVLVGPNNTGKSSILRAYEVVMSHGSKEGNLTLNDFPNGIIDQDNRPEIELVTVVGDNSPGEEWIKKNENDDLEVKERWFWEREGAPVRQGWNVKKSEWDQRVPWGAPNVAKARRPEPHRVSAFDDPEKQSQEITKILLAALQEKIKSHVDCCAAGQQTPYAQMLEAIKEVQKTIVSETEERIGEIERDLRSAIQNIFPDHDVKFDAKPEQDLEKTINLFGNKPELKMGLKDGYLSPLEHQGSGARRTMLWAALKIVSEMKRTAKNEGRPHVLLLDEPEICLHPNAIREACDVLYTLPSTGNWQVMVTTHSPCFIDVSRDNTTIIRVERSIGQEITGTTIFRPSRAQLDDDDKQRLKLLNLCDPYVAEFFFGGQSIIVEGDTEFTAFNYMKEQHPDKFPNVHIIRARGKATIVSLMKILNHFGTPYSVLHDTDRKTFTNKDGQEKANSAWTNNFKILEEADKRLGFVRLVASVPNFEAAYFDEELKTEKPYTALAKLKTKPPFHDSIFTLFQALVDPGSPLPDGATEWKTKEDLEHLGL